MSPRSPPTLEDSLREMFPEVVEAENGGRR